MFKSTIIAIILFMMSLSAGAAPKVLTYEDYIHLSDDQKNEYVIKLMELSVELESRYAKETAEYGFSQERFERYSKILRTLKSALWIDSAYAAPNTPTKPTPKPPSKENPDWHQMAVNFNKLMNSQQSTDGKNKDETCIFAGWVSRVIYLNGKPTCTHPDFIDGNGADRHSTKMAPESKGYPYPKNTDGKCHRDDKKMIQCNPVIFGYKHESDKSLFCVPAEEDARNASFRCMKAALEENPADADPKEQRLKFLRNQLGDPKNSDVFKQVWEFTYKTCVCDSVSATTENKKYFSQKYQNQIRPHRTCYGLMEMMGATALECTAPVDQVKPFPTKDTQIFTELRKQLNRNNLTDTDKSADVAYSNFLTSLTSEGTKNQDYYRLCKPDQVKYACSADCSTDADGKINCTYGIKEMPANVDVEAEATPTSEIKADSKQVTVKFSVNGKENTLACDISGIKPKDVPKDEKTYACSAECEQKDAPPAKAGEAAGVGAIECKYSVTVKEGDKTSPAEYEGTPAQPTDLEKTPFEISIKIKGETAERKVSCDLKKKEATINTPVTADKPTLKVTPNCKEIATCEVKAEWEKDKFPDWKLSWKFENVPAGQTVPDKGDSPTIIVPKLKENYTAVAKLTAPDKDPVSGSAQIEKLAAPAVAPAKPSSGPMMMNGNGMQQMPQIPIRGTSDTSAVGIK